MTRSLSGTRDFSLLRQNIYWKHETGEAFVMRALKSAAAET